jgi:hypothetical protein
MVARSRLLERARRARLRLRPEAGGPEGTGGGQARAEGAPQLFFVVGRAKSGTSWLMRMLDSHPELICRGEGKFFGTRHRLGGGRGRSLERVLRDSEELREWAGRSPWTREGEWEERSRRFAAELARASLLAAVPERSGIVAVGDKTPLNGPGVVASIGAALPEARVIHIVRDGRDVAVSSAHHRWNELERGGTAPAEAAALRDEYRRDPGAFWAAGRSIFGVDGPGSEAESWAADTLAACSEGRELGPDRYAELTYEALLDDSAAALERLLAFLGASVDPKAVATAVARNRFERLSGGRRAGTEDSGSFYRSGTAGGWREVFTPADREAFAAAAGEALIELGYEPDRSWAARPSPGDDP